MSDSGNAEIFGNGIEFVGRVRQLRQGAGKPRAIDAGALPEIGIGAGRETPRRRLGGALAVGGFCAGIEQRIAKAGHRLGALLLARQHAQRFQARGRRQHRHRLALQQPRRFADSRRTCRGSRRPASRSPRDGTAAPSARPRARPAATACPSPAPRPAPAAFRTVRWQAPDRTGRTCRRHRWPCRHRGRGGTRRSSATKLPRPAAAISSRPGRASSRTRSFLSPRPRTAPALPDRTTAPGSPWPSAAADSTARHSSGNSTAKVFCRPARSVGNRRQAGPGSSVRKPRRAWRVPSRRRRRSPCQASRPRRRDPDRGAPVARAGRNLRRAAPPAC